MIKALKIDGGKTGHFFVCDACGKTIQGQGVAISPIDGEEVRHAHRGPCHRQVEIALGGRANWQSLQSHLFMLMNNAGLKHEDLTERFVVKDEHDNEWESP